MTFAHITVPHNGQPILLGNEHHVLVPDHPIIPFIEGDGIGAEITPAMRRVVDAAVDKAYSGKRGIAWMEIYAGEKASQIYGDDIYLPAETVAAIRKYVVGIKGPLTTPVGGGIRSLNVALRQQLDQYVCKRPIRYYPGINSPVRYPDRLDVVVFRENTEDLYSGIEYPAASQEAHRLQSFLEKHMAVEPFRFPDSTSIGIKPISKQGSRRLMHRALHYALQHHYKHVTVVHSGNHIPFTEGLFKEAALDTAREELGAQDIPGSAALCLTNKTHGGSITINDMTVGQFFRTVLENPKEIGIVACPNVIGDYLSDFLAAQVGGIGISPGANLSDTTAIFEATHGTAPDIAGTGQANPSSLILSAVMMLNHIGWVESAQVIKRAMHTTIANGQTTSDLNRQLGRALDCTEFTAAVISHLEV